MADYLITAELVGADKITAALKRMPVIVATELSKALNISARGLRDLAAGNAPYLTGNLKTSIHPDDSTPAKLEARVGTNVVYARAQEYGTVGYPISTRYGQYFGNIKAKFYMKRAVETYQAIHENNIKKAISNIINLNIT